MVAGFRVDGLNQCVRALKAVGLDVEDLKAAFGKIAARGAQIAKGHVDSRTGALAGSIRGNRAQRKAIVTAGRGRTSLYAGPINYGWPAHGIEPQHYMQKADRALGPIALELLQEDVNASIVRNGLQ